MKTRELTGCGTIIAISDEQLERQSRQLHGTPQKRAIVAAYLGSSGANGCLAGYMDNDVTADLVNAKHSDTLKPDEVPRRRGKASSQVRWA